MRQINMTNNSRSYLTLELFELFSSTFRRFLSSIKSINEVSSRFDQRECESIELKMNWFETLHFVKDYWKILISGIV